MKKTKSKLWIFNAVICALCVFSGVWCIINNDLLFGIINLLLGIANGTMSVLGYFKKN